jgi:Bacterial Ig domain
MLHFIALPLLFAVVLVLNFVTAAEAQQPVPGRYEMEWSNLNRGQLVDLTNGTRFVDVVNRTPGAPPPAYTQEIRDATTGEFLWFVTPDGRVAPPDELGGGALLIFSANSSFLIQAEVGGRGANVFLAVARPVAAPPPPPPPAATVTITSPANGSTISGTVPINVTASRFASGTLKYFILVDGVQRWFWVTSSTSITQWWGTSSVPNGTHSIRVRVEDTKGSVTSDPVNVIVRNP